jgi:hypothetical protein
MVRISLPPASRKGIAAWPARTVAIMSTDIPPAQPSSSSLMPNAEALLTRTLVLDL